MLPAFRVRLARPRRSPKPPVMSGRHLQVFSPAARGAAPVTEVRCVLPGRALIVADADADVAALSWALRLVEELAALGRAPAVVLSSFSVAPDAAVARFERVSGAGPVHGLHCGQGMRDPSPLAPAGDALWVLVGQPVLLACEGWLSVLVGADVSPARWAPGLRGLRERLTLELSGAGLSVARELAHALAAR
jgi:hypothetical protein